MQKWASRTRIIYIFPRTTLPSSRLISLSMTPLSNGVGGAIRGPWTVGLCTEAHHESKTWSRRLDARLLFRPLHLNISTHYAPLLPATAHFQRR